MVQTNFENFSSMPDRPFSATKFLQENEWIFSIFFLHQVAISLIFHRVTIFRIPHMLFPHNSYFGWMLTLCQIHFEEARDWVVRTTVHLLELIMITNQDKSVISSSSRSERRLAERGKWEEVGTIIYIHVLFVTSWYCHPHISPFDHLYFLQHENLILPSWSSTAPTLYAYSTVVHFICIFVSFFELSSSGAYLFELAGVLEHSGHNTETIYMNFASIWAISHIHTLEPVWRNSITDPPPSYASWKVEYSRNSILLLYDLDLSSQYLRLCSFAMRSGPCLDNCWQPLVSRYFWGVKGTCSHPLDF